MLDTLDIDLKLKIQYLFTAIFTIMTGLVVLIVPDILMPDQDPLMFGAVGCVWLTFGILSLLAIIRKEYMKFVPILLLQLIYKLIWFGAVVIPAIITGHVGGLTHALTILVFAAFIIGDILFIPFKEFFEA